MSTAIILAAGYGTRMRSARPKAMHPIGGQPMLRHLLASCRAVFDDVVVVVGPEMDDLAALAAPSPVVVQYERLGTAHAALEAAALFGDDTTAVLYADNPLVGSDTLLKLRGAGGNEDLAMLAMRPPDPGRYGRLIVENGRVARVVEYAEATPAERTIALCNAGGFCASGATLLGLLRRVRASASGEYYLTDIVGLAERAVALEGPYDELRGINTRRELAEAEATVQRALRARALESGVSMIAPETVFLSFDTTFERDVSIGPMVVFGPGVSVGEGCEIRAFSHLEGCAIAAGAIIGPYARIRPGCVVEAGAHVGNFVELKATRLGCGAKVNHLTYLGDASVGAGANIGAGSITCNYDGVTKHRTEIGAGVFIGSASTLVAPLSIGDGAFVAAGSVITEVVPADALAFGRARQTVKPAMAGRLRRWLRDRAA